MVMGIPLSLNSSILDIMYWITSVVSEELALFTPLFLLLSSHKNYNAI